MTKIIKFFLVMALYASTTASASTLNIIVSLAPFYNITAAVMQDVGTPQLLLKQNVCPHDYQLKPSEAKMIDSADLVIWGGPELEGYLSKSVRSLADKELNLLELPGLALLSVHNSANWQQEHDHHHHHDDKHTKHTHIDPHFWLDPDNAIIIASNIAAHLGEIDPPNAKTYAKNATEFAKKINQRKKQWLQELAPYKKNPYITAHDALQYFDTYFGLDGVGSITLQPDMPPSIKRIQQIQGILAKEEVRCIFTEPQFNTKIIQGLVAGTNVHIGQLDPIGQLNDLGPNGYMILMNNLVNNFISCNKN